MKQVKNYSFSGKYNLMRCIMSVVSYISLTVEVSVDGRTWHDCCGDEDKTNFYLDDKKDEVDKIQTNSFSDLVASRFVRIKVSTSLRWVGNDDKCFRFEILGCSESESVAESNLSAVATSHGYIHVSWNCPNVSLTEEDDLTLDSRYYSVTLTSEDGNQVRIN